MQKEIRKVKITKGRTLEVELIEHLDNNSAREISMKCDQLIHDDMITAFSKLKFHLAKICDLYEANGLTPEVIDLEVDLKSFTVTSFSIGGNDDQEGVTLTGQKKLGEGGKILNLNTPFTKWEDELDQYAYASELSEAVHACIYEAEQYLYEEKFAVKQLELPFDEETVVDAANETINSPKKGRKKKLDYTVTVLGDDGSEHDITNIL